MTLNSIVWVLMLESWTLQAWALVYPSTSSLGLTVGVSMFLQLLAQFLYPGMTAAL